MVASDPAHAIDRQQPSQARFVPLRRRPRMLQENASTSLDIAILPDCTQTPSDACPAPEVLPVGLAFVLSVCSWEKAKHVGLKMSRCGFSSLNVSWALTWSASSPRTHPTRKSNATPALKPNAPTLLEPCWRVRLRQCYSISSERLGIPPGLLHAVASHRSWTGLHASTTFVIRFMTGIFCTAVPRRLHGVHPEPRRVSVALGPLLAPLRSLRIFFPHPVPDAVVRRNPQRQR